MDKYLDFYIDEQFHTGMCQNNKLFMHGNKILLHKLYNIRNSMKWIRKSEHVHFGSGAYLAQLPKYIEVGDSYSWFFECTWKYFDFCCSC